MDATRPKEGNLELCLLGVLTEGGEVFSSPNLICREYPTLLLMGRKKENRVMDVKMEGLEEIIVLPLSSKKKI
jgi:hypothetical protein